MNVNATGALSSYTYQSTLTQTGSASQALSQALAASQSQVDEMSSLFSSAGQGDPLASLAASSGLAALSSLTYSAATASGNGADALQALLGSSSATSSLSSLFSTTGGQSMSVAMLSPGAAEALVRYTYNQSQNQTTAATTTAPSTSPTSPTTAQLIVSGKQTLLTSGLNLLA
jgi:hypothetical protein